MTSLPSSSKVLSDLGFAKLGQWVYLYNPETCDRIPSQPPNPSLIILCPWMFAQPRHVAKYVIGYQGLYPDSEIVLIWNEIGNMTWRPESFQRTHFEPAAIAIEKHMNRAEDPALLLHTFSNGGSHAAVQTAETYRYLFAKDIQLQAIVLDSTPGVPGLQSTVSAVVHGLPKSPAIKAFGTILTYGVISLCGFFHELGLAELAAAKMCRYLNNPAGPFLFRNGQVVPRTYLYSEADQMIPAADIVQHARQAQESTITRKKDSMDLIKLEEFVGSSHVQHMTLDKDRYWRIVDKTWASRTEA